MTDEIKQIEQDRAKRFMWMHNYCKSNFLDPMINENWHEAQDAYEKYLKDQENSHGGKQ